MTHPPDPPGGPPDGQGEQPAAPAEAADYPAQQPAWPAGPLPDNYLVAAILTTLFCCPPTGIVSIIYSTKVSALWMQGLHDEAQAAANNAKRWAIISAIVWGVLLVGFIVFLIVTYSMGVSITNVTPSTTMIYHHH